MSMKKNIHFKILYIFFIFLSLNIFFFSTDKVDAKSFDINNIKISKPFEMDFDKNKVINEGFRKAFLELVSLIVNSEDQKKIGRIKLNEIKVMVESFSIKEERFIDETYYVNLGVSFNKKKVSGVFKYLFLSDFGILFMLSSFIFISKEGTSFLFNKCLLPSLFTK